MENLMEEKPIMAERADLVSSCECCLMNDDRSRMRLMLESKQLTRLELATLRVEI